MAIEKINTSDLELEIEETPQKVETAPMANNSSNLSENFSQMREQNTTLLEFPAKRQQPDWRDEIKNIVQQRKGGEAAAAATAVQTAVKTVAKPERAERKTSAAESSVVINLKPNLSENPSEKRDVVASALKRIEKSRQKFSNDLPVDFDSNNLQAKPSGRPASVQTRIEVEAKKEAEAKKENDLPLKLVRPRKTLPIIEDDSVAGFDDKFEIKRERKSVINVPLNVPLDVPSPPKTEPKIETVRESSIATDLDGLDEDFDVAAAADALQSVRKTSVRKSSPEEQQPVERAKKRETPLVSKSNDDCAPLVRRTIAGLVDLVVCAGITVANLHFALGIELNANINQEQILQSIGLFAGVLFLYSTVTLLLFGTTLGLRLFGMSVVKVVDGKPPGLFRVIVNNLLYLVTLATGGIGLLTVLFSSEKRAFHNLLSGTVVIRES